MTRKQLLSSPEYWKVQFSIAIYESMKEAKLTQKQLAAKLGMSQSFLSQVINEVRTPSIEMFVRILLACGKVPVIKIENLKDQK